MCLIRATAVMTFVAVTPLELEEDLVASQPFLVVAFPDLKVALLFVVVRRFLGDALWMFLSGFIGRIKLVIV